MEINSRIWQIADKNDEKLLRKKLTPFDFNKFSKEDIRQLIKSMREIMIRNKGMGLAANQIGLDMRVFVASVDGKFYAIFNPEITKSGGDPFPVGEGCLSVGGEGELRYRPGKITLVGQDRNGKKIKINAWGLLAFVFQHEMDHLNGKLYIDSK